MLKLVGNHTQNWVANDLICGIAEDSRCGRIPTSNDAVEILANSWVVRTCDDRGALTKLSCKLSLLRAILLSGHNPAPLLVAETSVHDSDCGLCSHTGHQVLGLLQKNYRPVHGRRKGLPRLPPTAP